MVDGAFKWLRHAHEFEFKHGVATIRDSFERKPSFGRIGRLVDLPLLRRHLHRVVSTKIIARERIAEERLDSQINQP